MARSRIMSGEPEIEDDPGEMVEHIAYQVMLDQNATDATKEQFREALVKLIDERIAEALKREKS